MTAFVALVLLVISGTGCLGVPSDTIDFFPGIKDNLSKISWAHAVNSTKYLEEVLAGDIMMVEADIVLGTLLDNPDMEPIPIMGHPPDTTSDLSLNQFLSRIREFNSNTKGIQKGVKLDFKSIEVFEMSASTIDALYNEVEYPVWINADILRGPIASQGTPCDPVRFLKVCAKYPAAMISPGWTTEYKTVVNGTYDEEHITEMLDALKANPVPGKLTFPIRAGIGANSKEQMLRLLNESGEGSTLTIWSSVGDYVNVEMLRNMIKTIGLNRVYVDVPKDLKDELNLE